ncbi:ABC transporter ATP-binding protein [Gudongella sp. SC589]|uniref:ABC transporter ATP-binding protein n=1 Tax=Gudongella sp. SC589 TaxID=3385990 RepID=UPI0039049205
MVIKVRGVSISRNSKYILKNIDWTVKEGENWAILGLNGSGKTTLLNMINGYIFPSEGAVSVLGKTFGGYDLRELRKSIGWVSTALAEKLYGNETALEIVVSGRYASIGLFEDPIVEDVEYAMELLHLLDCRHLADRIYNTLSQGEKQRILIARGLMAKPSLLILDEPCSGLDIFSREKVLATIDGLARSENAPTLIYVTHQTEEILPVFSHALLMRRGEIHSKGYTKDLLTKENLTDFFETEVNCSNSNERYSVGFDL